MRALKKELEGDEGTIFRYATHENSTLAAIDRQLAKEANAPKDRAALQQFIRSIKGIVDRHRPHDAQAIFIHRQWPHCPSGRRHKGSQDRTKNAGRQEAPPGIAEQFQM